MYMYITLKTNAFIARDEIVFATHLYEYNITQQMNAFNASDQKVSAYSPTNMISHCRRTRSSLATS